MMYGQRLIISLFDYTGNWSRPYRNAGYDVLQVDIKHGLSVFDVEPRPCHGILAAPPCTEFSNAGVHQWPTKDADGRTDAAIALVERTLWLINRCEPRWWVIENPPGRMARLVPGLQAFGPRYFQPYWYGDNHAKKTALYGIFNLPLQTHWPTKDRINWKWADTPMQPDIAEFRSRTPNGFARAFWKANP